MTPDDKLELKAILFGAAVVVVASVAISGIVVLAGAFLRGGLL